MSTHLHAQARRSVLALDIGGSGARLARVDARGAAEEILRAPFAETGSLASIEGVIAALLGRLGGARESDVGLGVAFPAFMGPDGRVAHALNLPGLEGVALEAFVRERAGIPVVAVPDVACAALAEARLGSGAGIDRFLCVALGTGANAAMTVHGAVLETAFGCLGDAGHVSVDPAGPPCACGGTGCLEAIAAGPALEREGRRHGFESIEELGTAASAGSADATAVLAAAGRALGRAIACWSALLWPDRVAVSGGVAALGELLLAPARAEVARVGPSYIVGTLEIVPASLGRDATLIGAGVAALAAFESPTR